jgi:transposase
MARKEIVVEELVEVLYQWHQGRNSRQIKHSLGFDRKTIRKYLELAERHGLSRETQVQQYDYYLQLANSIQKGLKTPVDSSPAFKRTALYQTLIEKLLSKKYMKPKQVYRILKRDHGYPLSYSSFKRYMNIKYPKQPRNCLRIEVKAAEEAQVDFGSAGLMYDPETGRMRRAHIFIMTLSYSRLPYVEFVFDQGQVTWVKCHIHAFEFFGGVPERIILDNLKSGILRPNTYDPVFNRAYAECAKHYGFIIDPAKIAMGEHKGKVERKIPTVRQQFLSSHDFRDISEANEEVGQWCLQEHFDMPLWKEAKVHPDHHIVFDKNYYSVPTRYVGKKVWVRGGLTTVQVFSEGELIKTHVRSYGEGVWRTDETDYPPHKSRYLLRTTEYYQQEALIYGEYVCQVVTKIMTEHAYRNLRKVQAIFRLSDKYGAEAMNLTCRRCIFYEDYRLSTLKRILLKQLYQLPLSEETTEQGEGKTGDLSFVRPPEYFAHTKENAL